MTLLHRALIQTGRGCAYAACGAAVCVVAITSIVWVRSAIVSAQLQQETDAAAARRVAIKQSSWFFVESGPVLTVQQIRSAEPCRRAKEILG